MVVALQSDESGVRYAMGQFQPLAVGDAPIVAAVKDESGYAHHGEPLTNVDYACCILDTYRVMRRGGDAHELIHPSNLFGSAFGNETRSKHLAERRIVLTPSVKDQGLQRLKLGNLCRIRAGPAPCSESTVKDETC